MARTRKSIQPLNLYKYDVLIEDKATRSDYFKVTQFDGNFYGGRNAFLLAGTGVLRPNSKILVEVLNKDGATVYSAPVTSFVEGNSRLVQIEVYSDTPIGPGKIVLLGCADTYLDGTPVPANWEGKYNVRWITDVVISPLIENKTPIRFEATPSIVATEKFYYTPSSSQFVEQIKVPVDIELTPKYYNVFPNGYLAKIRGPNNTKYNSDYLGGAITGAIALSNGTISTTASINIPITKIYNSTLGESQGTLIYINNTLFSKGILSSSGIYTTEIEPFGLATISSSINIQYNKLTTLNTGSAVSFAKLRLVDLKTISGEIHKIRLSYKATTEPGEFVSLGDINTTVAELLAVDSSSRIAETGQFTDIKIDDYWYSETMSLQKNEANPTLPTYYISSSLSSSYLAIVQSSATALDSISATPQIVNGRYINDVSYFIGTKNTNTIQVFPRVEYTLAFDATVSNTSASVALNQTDYSLEVYLVAEAGYSTKLLDTNPRGQLLGTLTPTSTFQRQNFEGTEFNFIPKIIANGNFGLRFIAYGGFWNIANVSVKAAQEPFFSPDEIDILISNVNYADKILTFKAEYLDVNNNSIGLSTLSLPTYFTGSDVLQGNANSSISASYALTSSAATSITFTPLTASYALTAGAAGGGVVGTGTVGRFTIWNGVSSIGASSLIDAGTSITSSVPITGSISNAVTASYAATASNVLGGLANYIPLWASATLQSSSNIYQSAGNIGIGTTTPVGYGAGYTTLAVNNTTAGVLDLMANGVSQFRLFGDTFENRLHGVTNALMTFYTNNAERMRLDSVGNVVVGGTSTQAKLTVFTGNDPEVGYGFSVGKYPRQLVMGYHTASNYGFIISTETGVGYQPLALQQFGGNVGIGTTSPSEKLEVVGVVKTTTLTSTQTTGTAPFTVASTTVVTNLNADLLDGYNPATTNTVNTIVLRDGSGNFSAGTITAALSGNATTATTVNGTIGQLLGKDDRIIEPNSISNQYLQFGFTSWANDNAAPYADFLHMRSYSDGTGGNDNLIVFKKDTIGMRIYQQAFGSATAYSSYADVWTSVNDGAGSGLDADLLDGLDSSNFVQTTTDQNISGAKVFYSPSTTFINTVTPGNQGLTVYQVSASTDAYMTFHVGGDYAGYFGLGGAENDLVWGGCMDFCK